MDQWRRYLKVFPTPEERWELVQMLQRLHPADAENFPAEFASRESGFGFADTGNVETDNAVYRYTEIYSYTAAYGDTDSGPDGRQKRWAADMLFEPLCAVMDGVGADRGPEWLFCPTGLWRVV